jgi:hypothetical protein
MERTCWNLILKVVWFSEQKINECDSWWRLGEVEVEKTELLVDDGKDEKWERLDSYEET